jgi:DNA-binding transcriptional ArsR family regulator
MNAKYRIPEQAALCADPGRAAILLELLGGDSLPATQLALRAHISAQSASMHLSKLVAGGLLNVTQEGRHRYYRLAGPEVAHLVEALGGICSTIKPEPPLTSRVDDPIRFARICYDHLAGRLAINLTDAFEARRHLEPRGRDYVLTPDGDRWFQAFGIDLVLQRSKRRAFARRCLDWTERKPHMAGSLGAALLARMLDLGWVARIRDSRAIRLTDRGRDGFQQQLGLDPYSSP